MATWQKLQWKKACEGDMLSILDVHKTQSTDKVCSLFSAQHTTSVYVPPGCTSLIQPLDVSFNALFKEVVSQLATVTEHVSANLSTYIEGTIPAREGQVLLTQWVGQAWEELSANKEAIQRSLRKCGMSVPIDGSQDIDTGIEGLEGYKVSTATNQSGLSDELDEENNMEAEIQDDKELDQDVVMTQMSLYIELDRHS